MTADSAAPETAHDDGSTVGEPIGDGRVYCHACGNSVLVENWPNHVLGARHDAAVRRMTDRPAATATAPVTEAGKRLFDDVRIHNVAQRVKADDEHDERWLRSIRAIEAAAAAVSDGRMKRALWDLIDDYMSKLGMNGDEVPLGGPLARALHAFNGEPDCPDCVIRLAGGVPVGVSE